MLAADVSSHRNLRDREVVERASYVGIVIQQFFPRGGEYCARVIDPISVSTYVSNVSQQAIDKPIT